MGWGDKEKGRESGGMGTASEQLYHRSKRGTGANHPVVARFRVLFILLYFPLTASPRSLKVFLRKTTGQKRPKYFQHQEELMFHLYVDLYVVEISRFSCSISDVFPHADKCLLQVVCVPMEKLEENHIEMNG